MKTRNPAGRVSKRRQRTRWSVGFTPSDVSGLVAWFDFSDIATLWKDTARTSAVTADADVIKGVTDKSGGAHHMSEATNGPAYKVGIINSKSIARLDGSNDILTTTGNLADASHTLFIVGQKRSAVGGTSQTLISGGATSYYFVTNSGQSATGYCWYANSGPGFEDVGGTATDVSVMVARVNSTSSADVYANGGTAHNFNPDDQVTTAQTRSLGSQPGGANFGDFDVGEYLEYSSALTAADINRVGNYLASKWGVAWTTAT